MERIEKITKKHSQTFSTFQSSRVFFFKCFQVIRDGWRCYFQGCLSLSVPGSVGRRRQDTWAPLQDHSPPHNSHRPHKQQPQHGPVTPYQHVMGKRSIRAGFSNSRDAPHFGPSSTILRPNSSQFYMRHEGSVT